MINTTLAEPLQRLAAQRLCTTITQMSVPSGNLVLPFALGHLPLLQN
jgi:hypothetical protein